MTDKPLDCVGVHGSKSQFGKDDFRPYPWSAPIPKPGSYEISGVRQIANGFETVLSEVRSQKVDPSAELAAVTRERDALKIALDLIAQHDGGDLAPAHRAIVRRARDILTRLASGKLRKPAQKPAP